MVMAISWYRLYHITDCTELLTGSISRLGMQRRNAHVTDSLCLVEIHSIDGYRFELDVQETWGQGRIDTGALLYVYWAPIAPLLSRWHRVAVSIAYLRALDCCFHSQKSFFKVFDDHSLEKKLLNHFDDHSVEENLPKLFYDNSSLRVWPREGNEHGNILQAARHVSPLLKTHIQSFLFQA